VKVGQIQFDSDVVSVSWNSEANRLLIGCASSTIQLWSYNPNQINLNESDSGEFIADAKNYSSNKTNKEIKKNEKSVVTFSICEDIETSKSDSDANRECVIFEKKWETK
jgi:hypothetical protein